MKIDVVKVEIKKVYKLDLPVNSEYVYGIEEAEPIFCYTIGANNTEFIAMLCLDNTNKIVNYSNVSIGDLNHANVSISQIAKIALLSNSAKVVIAHNHPSQVLEITNADIESTQKIWRILTELGIQLIDSIVVNNEKAISIRERIGGKSSD